jgi:flavin-dependent thymidylate synthase
MTKDIQRWADPAMFGAEKMEKDEAGEVTPRVYLLSATSDPLGAVAAACMMYEGHVCRDIGDINDDMRRHYWEQVQKTHLKAPLEFVDLHFMVEGVTRGFTHQMVRQRTAVYAQESLRFAVKEGFADEVPYPPSLAALADRKRQGYQLKDEEEFLLDEWDDAVAEVERGYQNLVNKGVPAEDARGLLPHSITTRLNYKTNLRNLLDHAGNRLCTQAQFEWRVVFAEIVKAIAGHESTGRVERAAGMHGFADGWRDYSWQFKHIAESNVFKPVCYELGHCPFTADFDRGCTIRGRVEEGKFEEINPAEWLMDPAAARRGG